MNALCAIPIIICTNYNKPAAVSVLMQPLITYTHTSIHLLVWLVMTDSSVYYMTIMFLVASVRSTSQYTISNLVLANSHMLTLSECVHHFIHFRCSAGETNTRGW